MKATKNPPHYAEKTVVDEKEYFEKLYAEACVLVRRESKASTSFIQRHLQLGYNRAAEIIERMEKEGIVTPANSIGKRDVVGAETKGAADTLIEKEQKRVDDEKAAAPELPIDDRANDVGGVSGQRLKAFIERVERLEEEKAALAEDIKEVMAEAKGTGFDTKIMRKIIRLRKMDSEKRQEEDALLDLYKAAIGLD